MLLKMKDMHYKFPQLNLALQIEFVVVQYVHSEDKLYFQQKGIFIMTRLHSIKEAQKVLQTIGEKTTIIFKGTFGIAKSTLLSSFDANKYTLAYIDCANLELGDLAIPVVDQTKMETNWAPNSRFGLYEASRSGKPLVIMLDELGKANVAVINMLLPLILERRIGDRKIPNGSIVFATTNFESDSVGDMIPAHGYNRVTVMNLHGPSPEEWAVWATNNDIDPILISWILENKHAFDTYIHQPTGIPLESNHFIYKPERQDLLQFVTPRSLTHCSPILNKRDSLGYELTQSLIEGTVGSAAAMSIRAHAEQNDKLPKIEDVLKNPETCDLPPPLLNFLMVVKLVIEMKPETIEPLSVYASRLNSPEALGLLCNLTMQKTILLNHLRDSKTFNEISNKYLEIYLFNLKQR